MRWLGWTITVIVLLVLLDVAWWLGFGVTELTPWSLRQLVKQNSAPLIVDVRPPADYRSYHIPGAVNVPGPSILSGLAYATPDPRATVVVVGLSSGSAADVERQLVAGGYTDVVCPPWSMIAWKLLGGEVVEGEAPGPLPQE